MSITNLTHSSSASPFAYGASTTRNFLHKYAISITSITGIVLNLLTLLLLLNKRFKSKFYDFLRCRCFWNLVVCVYGSFYIDYFAVYCEKCLFDYWPLVTYTFAVHIPLRIFWSASFIAEILLILNRLCLLSNKKKSLFFTLSKKANLIISFIIPVVFFIPAFTGVKFVRVSDTKAYWTVTETNTIFYQVYALIVLLFENIFPIALLIFLNTVSVVKFKRLMKSKMRLVNSSVHANGSG